MRGFYEYAAREEREAREAAALLETFPGLNQRQRSLIHDALKTPDCLGPSPFIKASTTSRTRLGGRTCGA
jgi:hypothetical protein